MEDDKESCDFHYFCNRCKRLVPGHTQDSENDEIIMMREKVGSSTFIFECFACHYNLW